MKGVPEASRLFTISWAGPDGNGAVHRKRPLPGSKNIDPPSLIWGEDSPSSRANRKNVGGLPTAGDDHGDFLSDQGDGLGYSGGDHFVSAD